MPKFKHVAAEVLKLAPPELAVMCSLMLSGAQTVGEIRTRASRMHSFVDLEEVEETLRLLTTKEPDPMVVRLPRQAGQKEARFAQLLAGEPQVDQLATEEVVPKTTRRAPDTERVEKLEQQIEVLATQIEDLRVQFEKFRKQFD